MIAWSESQQEPVMKQALILAMLSLFASEAAMAQGVSQPPTSTVTQQRQQNGSLVNGSPNTAISTNPQSPNGTFGSPFTSPFGTPAASHAKGGYAGNGVNR